jgi:hypothetical protein
MAIFKDKPAPPPVDELPAIADVTTNVVVDTVDPALQQQQNPDYEPPAGMRLNPVTNELEPIKAWAFDTPAGDVEIG